jgi:hypothetical protein
MISYKDRKQWEYMTIIAHDYHACDLIGGYHGFQETLVTTYKTAWRHKAEVPIDNSNTVIISNIRSQQDT